jgi:hypothetical protein
MPQASSVLDPEADIEALRSGTAGILALQRVSGTATLDLDGSGQAKDCEDCCVNIPLLFRAETTCMVSETVDIDGAHLLN